MFNRRERYKLKKKRGGGGEGENKLHNMLISIVSIKQSMLSHLLLYTKFSKFLTKVEDFQKQINIHKIIFFFS